VRPEYTWEFGSVEMWALLLFVVVAGVGACFVPEFDKWFGRKA